MAVRNVTAQAVAEVKVVDRRPIVNICIPVYCSGPEVLRVLGELLDSIAAQDYPRISVMASIQDAGEENNKAVRSFFGKRAGNETKPYVLTSYPLSRYVDGPAKNTNTAMSRATEGYIKLMNQDDLLDSPTAISEMVAMLDKSDARWLVNACIHTDGDGSVRERVHQPFWPGEKGMVEGVNRFGCPSVVMFDATLPMKCDPTIEYAMDCDMWIQLYQDAGAPVIRNTPDVVIRMWDAQLTNQLNTAAALERDKAYMRSKYGYQ